MHIHSLLYKRKSTGDYFMVDKSDIDDLDEDFIFISSIDLDEEDEIDFDENDVEFEFEDTDKIGLDKPRKIK